MVGGRQQPQAAEALYAPRSGDAGDGAFGRRITGDGNPKVGRRRPAGRPRRSPARRRSARGATPEPPSATMPTRKGVLLRHKRYPNEAQRAPGGRDPCAIHHEPRRSRARRAHRTRLGCGLAQEGLELLQRAQPLPPLPSDFVCKLGALRKDYKTDLHALICAFTVVACSRPEAAQPRQRRNPVST